MNHYKNMARQLTLAIRHKKEASLSIWHNSKWSELFVEEPGGLGAIKPAVAARVFSVAALDVLSEGRGSLEALTPDELEHKLCEQYIHYKNKGFWSRLWMKITQPVDTYRQAYTLITIRDMQKQYVNIGETASQLSDLCPSNIDQWSGYFTEVIAGQSACLRSYLPRQVGFFSRLFQREASYRYVYELQQFKRASSNVLLDEIESSYVAFLKKTEICPADKKDELRQEMKTWFDIHANSINDNKNGLNPFWSRKYNRLLTTVTFKYNLLLSLVTSEQPSEEIPFDVDKAFGIDKQFEQLTDDIATLEQDCEIKKSNDIGSIDTPIIQGIQKGRKEQGAKWCEGVADISPDKQEKTLVIEYSRQLEAEIFKKPIKTDNDIPAAMEKLKAYRHYIAQKNEALAKRQAELQVHATIYQDLLKTGLEDANKIKIRYMNTMVFETVTAKDRDNALHLSLKRLSTRYKALFNEERFLQLPPMLQRALKKEAAHHMAGIRKLKAVFEAIVTPRFQDKADEFFGTYSSATWMEDIRDYFNQAMKDYSATSYLGTMRKLQDIGKACFQDYVLQVPCHLSELRAIHVQIGKIKQEHVHRIQQQTRELMVLPIPEKKTILPHQFLRIAVESRPSELKCIVRELMRDFEEALPAPEQHSHGTWITMAKKPTLETLKTLPVVCNPAYIYVTEPGKGKTLYFVNRNTSLIEEIRLTPEVSQGLDSDFAMQASGSRLSQEQAIRITTLTNHSYDKRIYLFTILMEALVYRLESILWGLHEGNILFNVNCGLMRASKEQAEQIIKKLPWSHYIITPDNELFYYCKQENTLERHAYLNKKQQTIFKKQFPGNKYGYYSWLDNEQIQEIRKAITFKRNEDRPITTKQAIDITKREIGQLFRAISPLFHSDKNPESDAWQQYIGSKKAEAEARVNETFRLQQHLISEYNLLTDKLPQIPWEISLFVPGWIKKYLNEDIAAKRYCEFLREDKNIENFNSYTQTINDRTMDTARYAKAVDGQEKAVDRMVAAVDKQKEAVDRLVKNVDDYAETVKRVDEGVDALLLRQDVMSEQLDLMIEKLKEMVVAAEEKKQSTNPATEFDVPKGAEQDRFFTPKSEEVVENTEEHSESTLTF